MLVVDGVVQPCSVRSPSEVLGQFKRGVYTTATANTRKQLIDWNLHTTRLKLSAAALHEASVPGFVDLRLIAATDSVVSELIKPSVQLALSRFWAEQQDRAAVILILLCPCDEEQLSVVVHVSDWQPPPPDRPVQAIVLGSPRVIPAAKDSQWVQDRKCWEVARPSGCSEVLLLDREGQLLEGLVTNLFIVTNTGPEGPLLQTAPTGMVLDGVIRQHVLMAAQQLGVRHSEEGGHITDRHKWSEGFLTNCARLIQPLECIYCDGNDWLHQAPWRANLPQPWGPITRQLQHKIKQLQTYTALHEL